MRHGYNDHYRFQAKNPFTGEGCLVFVNAPETPIETVLAKGPEKKEMGELVELFPGSGQSTPLQRSMERFQILQGGMAYMDRINRYIAEGADGAFPWEETSEALEAAVNKLEKDVDGLNLNVDRGLFATITGKAESEKREQMVKILSTARERLVIEANKEAQRIHELYIDQFVEEYDALATALDGLPDVYKDFSEEKKKKYKECQDHLRSQTSTKIPLGDEKGLINVLQSYKHIFDGEKLKIEEAKSQAENPVDLDGLEKKLANVQDRKTKVFQARHGEYKSKISSVISELERLKRDISQSDFEEVDKNSRIKKLDALITEYRKNSTDSDAFAAMKFSDSSSIMEVDEEGNESARLLDAADGTKIEVPKGIKDRIALLRSGKLKPELNNVLASGITNELAGIEGALDVFDGNIDIEIDKTLTALKSEDIHGPMTTPDSFMGADIIFMSPMDIWSMLTTAAESFNRSFDRTSKRKGATLGSKLFKPLERLNFGPFQHFSVIPDDQKKNKTSSDNEEVERYQSVYKTGDDNSVIDFMHESRNIFQLKGCMNLLAERGRINWFDPLLLDRLNRWQNVIHFNTESMEVYHANVPAFHKGLSTAIADIYGDLDLFRNWNAQTQSSYASGKEKFKTELYNMLRARGGLQKLAIEMLREHNQSGGVSKVNPQKFEYVVEIGLMEGAMTPPEIGLYFLIQAAASGLLPYERLQFLYANKASAIPYLEIFNETIFDRKKLKEWASIDPMPDTLEAIASNRVPHKFMRWFHTYVMHHPRVRGRSGKIFAGGNQLDSDLAGLFLPYGADDVATTVLQIKPDGGRPERWLLNNASQYQLLALHNQLEHMDEMNKADKGGMENVTAEVELQNMISGFIQWDSIMDQRYMTNVAGKKYVNWTDSLKAEPPRANSMNNYFWDEDETKATGEKKYATAYDYAVSSRQIISQLDPEIFGILFKKGVPSNEEVAKVVEVAAKKYNFNFDGQIPKDADSLYNKISGLLGAIIKKQNTEGGTLRKLISEMKGQHKAFYAAQNKDTGSNYGEPIEFYPPVDEEGKSLRPATNNNWHITGS